MGNLNHSTQDQPLLPLLYIENIPEKQIEFICRQFSLKSEKKALGYLLCSYDPHSNFKISFLDLFFAALRSYSHFSDSIFFLFERNLLREELELSILELKKEASSVDHKINHWKSAHRRYSLSRFAQATLQQAGFISVVEAADMELNAEQLNKILDFNLSLRVKTNKIA